MIRSTIIAMSAWALVACDDNTECERARLQAFRAYQTLHSAAVQRKLAGVDVEQWAAVENKTDLLQSAFATQQVTWRSAEKTKQEVAAALNSVKTDNAVNLEIFKGSANEAFNLQEALAKQCK
jgi:hypothetical protein